MAIEVPVQNYLRTKCAFCGYGCYIVFKGMPNRNASGEMQEIVICERQTRECRFTPFT